jgi:hypothetical protein
MVVCLIMKLIYQCLFIVVEKVYTRSDELGLSPAARDTKLSSRAIAIIIRSLNNILFHIFRLFLSVSKHISIILREISVVKM